MNFFALFVGLTMFGAASPSIAAETYKSDKSHADLLFSIEHAGFTRKHGWFRDFDSTVQYDVARPQNSRVEVTVRTNSVDTGLPARDKDLQGSGFFDSTKYPEMHFVSTKVIPGKDQELRIEGELTLHGVTKPVILNARLNKAGPNPFDKTPMLGISGTGTLKRSDFGMTNLVPMVGDEVRLSFDIELKRQP